VFDGVDSAVPESPDHTPPVPPARLQAGG
jgi:hypothetical protein